MTDIKQGIKDVLMGLSQSFKDDAVSTLEDSLSKEKLEEIQDLFERGEIDLTHHEFDKIREGFFFLALEKQNKYSDSKIRELVNFYEMYSFTSSHVRAIIEMKEGFGCCQDKTNWVMKNIERYIKTDEETIPDYEAKYTYHLPKKVLNSTEQCMKLYKSLMKLYYGKPQDYFLFYHQMMVK